MLSDEKNINYSLIELSQELRLPASFDQIIKSVYLPLADMIAQKAEKSEKPTLISINGCQGSGKTTLTLFLKTILEQQYQSSTAIISLDDFYLKKAERFNLASNVHPLFITRGVPGTHDLNLMRDTIESLLQFQETQLPVFDKLSDDRLEKSQWHAQQPASIILFEGWCNNSPAQTEADLVKPINELEKSEDPDAKWRQYANDQLKEYNKQVFDLADMKTMLLSPGFEYVFQWRKKQEDKLALSKNNSNQHVMNEKELKRFIQHYERITRYSIESMPDTVADLVIPISPQQQLSEIKVKDGFR